MFDQVERMAKARADQALRDYAAFSAIADRGSKPSEQYSPLRALNALITDWQRPSKSAPLEVAMSDEIAKRVGRPPSPGCLFVPVDLQQRDVSVSGAGWPLTQEQLAPGGIFVSALRAASVMIGLGVREVPVTGNSAVFPKNVADISTYWLGSETTAITESQPSFVELPVTPRTVGCYVELGRLFLRQLSTGADNFLMRELAKPVAAEVDRAFLNGSGTAQPQGLLRTAGISTGSGASLDWPKTVDAIHAVEDVNAELSESSTGWALSPSAAQVMRKKSKESGSGRFILDGGTIDDDRALVSNSVPSGVAVYGDWSNAILATFGILEVGVTRIDNASTLFKLGGAAIRVLWSVDSAILHPSSFYSLTSIS